MIAKPGQDEYLNKPFLQATYADRKQYELDIGRLSEAVMRAREFLGVNDEDMVEEAGEYPLYDVPQVHDGLRECFPDWKVVGEYGCSWRQHLEVPSRQSVEIQPGRFKDYMLKGFRYFELPDGSRRIALFDESNDPNECQPKFEFSLIAVREHKKHLDEEWAKLRTWINDNHYLKGQVLRQNGTLLRRSETVTWDDIALEPATRDTIIGNTVGILELRETFQKLGIPQKRGILLHGPPGTGKTMVGKALAGLDVATFIYVTAADAEDMRIFRPVFDLARRLRPTIVFMEDLDLFAEDRGGHSYLRPLGELLPQLDGLAENDGLIFVATTNDLDAIEPALKDRPSRFDIVLEIGLPNQIARRQILETNLFSACCDDNFLDEVAAATDGLSGAQVREVAYAAVQEAILKGAIDDGGNVQPRQDDVEAALDRILGRRKQKLGFGKVGAEARRSNGRPAAVGSSSAQRPR